MAKKIPEPIRLNLAAGHTTAPGLKSVDNRKDAKPDILCDLKKYPWPWKDNSVDEILCAFYFNYLGQEERIKFLHEVHRVLKPNPNSDPQGSKAVIVTPHWAHVSAYQDPYIAFPPVVEGFYFHFNQKWLQENKITHYRINTDFNVVTGYPIPGGLHPDYHGRSDEVVWDKVNHNINAIATLYANLFKIK